MTDFGGAVDRAVALLEHRGRISQRALRLELGLDEETFEVLCSELVEVLGVAEDTGGVLVHRGAAPVAEQIERRLLTVLMCDLVASTPMSQQLDPEDLSAVMRRYSEICNEVIGRSGGHISSWIGDGVTVLFGYPRAAEDDALRAVRCGLELTKTIVAAGPALRAEHGVDVAVRAGVDTGRTVVGGKSADARGGTLAYGDAPNIAARIQSASEPNCCTISARTYRLVEHDFILEPLGAHELKGVAQPLELYQVREVVESQPRFTSRALGGLSELVGRDQERHRLHAACDAVCGGARAGVLLAGEPGIGKSRLVYATQAYAVDEGQMQVVWAECSPFLRNQSLHPIVAALGRHWHLDEPGALERVAGEGRTALLLADVLRRPGSDDPEIAAMSPGRRRQEGLNALRDAVLAQAARQPTLLIVEDLHWSDPTTLEWIGMLLEGPPAPLLVLLTARPDVEAPWLADLETIALERLHFSSILQLITDASRDTGISTEVARAMAERADGVPLFAEELTHAVIAEGSADEIPTSLYGCLMARLDRHDAARVVAQLAATVGRRFEVDLISALGEVDGTTLSIGLERLREDDVVTDAGSGSYEFRHALIQEAALSSLLRERRRHYEKRIAETLMARGADGEPERIARHLEYAGETQPAIVHWQSAGMLALQGSALREASSAFERALRLVAELPDSPEGLAMELGLRVLAPLPLVATQGWTVPAVREHYERAAELCAQVENAPQLIPAMLGLITFRIVNGQMEDAVALGTEQLAVAERLGDPGLILEVETEIGNCDFYLGRFAEARERLGRAAELYDPELHHVHAHHFGRDPYPVGQGHVAMAAAAQGDRDGALEAIERARAHMKRWRHPFSEAWVEIAACVAYYLLGDHDAMLDAAEHTTVQSIAEGFPNWLAQSNVHAGWAHAMRGEEGAVERARGGMEMWEMGGAVIMRPALLAELADAAAAAGDVPAATAAIDGAFDWLGRSDDRWAEPELHRIRARIALLEGDQEAARHAIDDGLQCAQRIGADGLAARLKETLTSIQEMSV